MCRSIKARRFSPRGAKTMQMWTSGFEIALLWLMEPYCCDGVRDGATECVKESRKETMC